jgi:hypothetical protein
MIDHKGGDFSRDMRKKFYKNVIKPGYKTTDKIGLTHHYSTEQQSNQTTEGGKRKKKTKKRKTLKRKRRKKTRKTIKK